jgi:hypothetical protein
MPEAKVADPKTGELLWKPKAGIQSAPAFLKAAQERLGNLFTIAELREQVARSLEVSSVLLSRVLVNGTHCGDTLSPTEIRQMEKELDHLEKSIDTKKLPALEELITSLRILAKAAREHENPVVFV